MDAWLQVYRRAWTHESVEEALAFYARLFDEAPAAILVTSPDFAIIDANVSAQQLLQRSLSTMKNKPFRLHVAAQDRAVFSAIARQILAEPGRVTRPLLLKSSDDRMVEVSLIACALRDEQGHPQSVVMVLLERGEDVTSDIL